MNLFLWGPKIWFSPRKQGTPKPCPPLEPPEMPPPYHCVSRQEGTMVRWWHFWRLEWWARLWSALFPGREPDLGAPEEQVHRWAARAEAASARTSFITLIMTIVGLGATLYVVNLTRFQVEALLQGLKPDVQIRTAT